MTKKHIPILYIFINSAPNTLFIHHVTLKGRNVFIR